MCNFNEEYLKLIAEDFGKKLKDSLSPVLDSIDNYLDSINKSLDSIDKSLDSTTKSLDSTTETCKEMQDKAQKRQKLYRDIQDSLERIHEGNVIYSRKLDLMNEYEPYDDGGIKYIYSRSSEANSCTNPDIID